MLGLLPEVKPSTSICHDYNSFFRQCHESQSPIVITRNGEADLVVMSIDTYQKMTSRQRLGQMLGKIDKEIAIGTPMRDFEDVFADLEARINENA